MRGPTATGSSNFRRRAALPAKPHTHLVVGGGVMGVATAWELARQGASVTLVEAAEIACGASGGFGQRGVRANGRDLRELPLMAMAYEIWVPLAGD